MIDFIYNIFGYKVYGFGYSKVHRTLSRREALEWMGCYDDGSFAIRRHKVVMRRNALRG